MRLFAHIKWILVISVLLLALHATVHAKAQTQGMKRQAGSLGLKIGMSFTTVVGYDKADIDLRSGGVMGVQFSSTKDRMFAIQIELLYVQKGCMIDHGYLTGSQGANNTSKNRTSVRGDYAELPILLKFYPSQRLAVRPNLFAGVAIASLLSTNVIYEDLIEGHDIGVVGGIGFDIPTGRSRFAFEIRYTYGLQPLMELDWVEGTIQNRAVLFTFGFIF